jgi:hypothetical protein
MLIKAVGHVGYRTETADTLIEGVIPPKKGCRTRVMKATYRSGTTAHVLTLMKPLGKTTLTAAAAASQAVVNITADPGLGTLPGAIAANDYVVLRKKSTGLCYLHKVSSVSTLAITLTANLAVALEAGDDFFFYGVTTNLATAIADGQMSLETTASAVNTYEGTAAGEGCFQSNGDDEPLIFSSNNATAAGFLRHIGVAYTDK